MKNLIMKNVALTEQSQVNRLIDYIVNSDFTIEYLHSLSDKELKKLIFDAIYPDGYPGFKDALNYIKLKGISQHNVKLKDICIYLDIKYDSDDINIGEIVRYIYLYFVIKYLYGHLKEDLGDIDNSILSEKCNP